MAGSINKAVLIGNLGADPEVRAMPSGSNVANFSVATSERWRDKEGNLQTNTEWHRVVVFDKLADIVAKYLKKGSTVYIEGKIKTRKWTDSNAIDRYTTEIVVAGFGGTLVMLDKKEDGSFERSGSYKPAATGTAATGTAVAGAATTGYKNDSHDGISSHNKSSSNEQDISLADELDDDIPF